MVSGSGDAKISQLWDIGYGVTQRVVDIINQCRYLASKRGMNLKELRQSLREDESKQRQLARYTDICSQQMQLLSPSGIHEILRHGTTAYPPWFGHVNNHGMIYSQYNTQNYGNLGSATVLADPWPRDTDHSKRSSNSNQRGWEYHNASKRENLAKEEKSEFAFSSEDNIFNKEKTLPNSDSASSFFESDQSNDNLVNLLYSANHEHLNEKTGSMINSQIDISYGRRRLYENRLHASSSELISTDFIKAPITVREGNFKGKCLDVSESTMECKLPARKLASHNLASLCAAEGDIEDDESKFGESIQSNLLDFDRIYNSDSDCESEIQVVEEIDDEKRVVSPLIKKVESAFSDLQKSDTLFGTMDDFGDLMRHANRIL